MADATPHEPMRLRRLHGTYAICRLAADARVPDWACGDGGLTCITRTDEELSIVCIETAAPPEVRAERGWAALRVTGTLAFDQVGLLARLTTALAEAGIPVFAISTYDTDILLVRGEQAEGAARALAPVAVIES